MELQAPPGRAVRLGGSSMSTHEEAAMYMQSACRGNITAQSAMRQIKATGFPLHYSYATTVKLGDAAFFINYSSTRVWAAYRADGKPVGEWVGGRLQPAVEAAIGQQRAET